MKQVSAGLSPVCEIHSAHRRGVPIRLAKAGQRLFLLFALLLGCASPGSSAQAPVLDGERIMSHVERIISHGPHPPGSEAQQKVGMYIMQQLESYGLDVRSHTFQAITPQGRLPMTNIWGTLGGERDSVIIIASHYDSKYFDDFAFVGANDGGSSSALLLELARVLSEQGSTEFTLWFVFFDGEEAIYQWTSADSLYGSREFVRKLKRGNQLQHLSGLILLDMVGEKDLLLRRDTNSTDWLNEIIWDTAASMGHQDIFQKRGHTGAVDDHLPFAREGIPVVDIIDLDYAHWHRKEDTIDKLSPHNLCIVGNVVLGSLPRITKRLLENP